MFNRVIRKVLTIICLLGLLSSACYLGKIGYEYYKSRKTYEAITETAVEDSTNAPNTEEKVIPEGYLDIDFELLKNENKDIIAWIDIPNTKISYPVLHGKDNESYLHKDYHNEDSVTGSIFVDARYDDPFSGQNTVVYGHNMKDGSMFRGLQGYIKIKNNLYNKAPYIHIYLEDKVIQIYKIVSAHVMPDEAYAYSNIVTDEFIKELQEYNKVPSPDSASINDHFITLITCTRGGSEYPYRTVVQARLEEVIN